MANVSAKTAVINFRTTPQLKARLETAAAKRSWTLGNFMHEMAQAVLDGELKKRRDAEIERRAGLGPKEPVPVPSEPKAKGKGEDEKKASLCPRCKKPLKAWGPVMMRCMDCGENFSPGQLAAVRQS